MIKRYLLGFVVLILYLLETNVSGQNIISGEVKDLNTKEGISGANVYIPDLKIGTYTDSLGSFEINNVVSGEYILNVSHIRFVDKSYYITCPMEGELEIFLEPDSVQISSYVITATRTKTFRGNSNAHK